MIPAVMASLMFGACANSHTFSNEIATVDSLLVVVNSYQLSLDSIDPDEVAVNLKAVHNTREFMIQNYKDSTDRRFWGSEMGYLSRVEKAYIKYEAGVNDFQTKLDESKKQLQTLRNSLEDEKLTTDEARVYVKTEKEVVQGMASTKHKLTFNTKSAHIIWEAKKPFFDSVAVSLGGNI